MKLLSIMKIAGVTAGLVAQSAGAMVDPGVDLTPLTDKLSGTEGIGPIVADSENPKQLYVRPTSKKFKGRFYQTSGAINCNELFEMRQLTYRYPTEEEFDRVIRGNQVYSPAFEANVGIFAKATGLITELNRAKKKVSQYINDHKEEYGRYESTRAEFDLVKGELSRAQEKMEKLQRDLIAAMAIATSEAEKAEIRADFRARIIELSKREVEIYERHETASILYSAALADWAPYRDELEWLTKIERSLSQSFENSQKLAEESLNRSERLISALESKSIGYASASYSFNPNSEINELYKRMREASVEGYSVTSLPVFNVRLNPGVTKNVRAASDNVSGVNYEMITYNFPEQTRQILIGNGQERRVEFPLIYENQEGQDRERISFLMADLDGSFGGAQSFEVPVTMGAICGYPITDKKKYEYTDEDGNFFSRDVTVTEYKSPSPNQPVFVQNVALRYNYYEKAKPFSGKCQLNLSQSSNYFRSRGSKSSWRWFKKVTHSWDDTTHNLATAMGLSCDVTEAPLGRNEVESRQMIEEMKNMLYQDMFSMFLMTYAKDYKVQAVEPTVSDERPQLFGNLGNGIMNICGSNKGCQIANVVLKTMDELVGSRHSGATSNRTTSTGTLTRDLSLQSYIVQEGFADFEMRVCVDHSKCDE